jgi:hypothetical protein
MQMAEDYKIQGFDEEYSTLPLSKEEERTPAKLSQISDSVEPLYSPYKFKAMQFFTKIIFHMVHKKVQKSQD